MASVKLDFKGFQETLKKLTDLNADVRGIATEALQKSFDIVTAKAAAAAIPANYPAGGKYSRRTPPNTASSLIRNLEITWTDTEATAPVGFDAKRGGLPSIFMIRGTPRHEPVQEMYDAFYSTQTKGEVLNAQRDVFFKAMEEAMGR